MCGVGLNGRVVRAVNLYRIHMVKTHLLLASLAGLCIYFSLMIVFGVPGTQNQRELENYLLRLNDNIDELTSKNTVLEARIADLQSDRALLRVYARSLGFFADNERRLILDSGVDVTEPMSPGALVYRNIQFDDNRDLIRLTAAIMAIGIFGLLHVLQGDSGRGARTRDTGNTQDRRNAA